MRGVIRMIPKKEEWKKVSRERKKPAKEKSLKAQDKRERSRRAG